MKRIANKVAVATICYGISGYQKIKIVDYENDYDLSWAKNGKVVYEGRLMDGTIRWEYTKWFNSECHGIRLEGDVMVFDIFTKYEQY